MLIGGHMDSVPNGGWLDGCLNVLAGAEVLRRIAEDGTPPVTVRLVDWADEEGARFGRSLFGSSAAAGSMADQDELRKLVDRDGVTLPDAIAAFDVDLDRALDAHAQLENAAAYLELHIEQGPVLESLDLPLGVVLGTFGVERSRITGRARPRTRARRRWTAAATRSPAPPSWPLRSATSRARPATARSAPRAASCAGPGSSLRSWRRRSNCSTSGTSTPRSSQRCSRGPGGSRRFAEEERVDVAWERIWSIEPILFDETLIRLADEAIREVPARPTGFPRGRSTTRPRSPARVSRR